MQKKKNTGRTGGGGLFSFICTDAGFMSARSGSVLIWAFIDMIKGMFVSIDIYIYISIYVRVCVCTGMYK